MGVFNHSPVFRVGGDEFAVISQGADYDNIERLIDELEIRNEQSVDNGGVVIACGMAKYEDDDNSVASVFKKADMAMYQNKNELKKHNVQ